MTLPAAWPLPVPPSGDGTPRRRVAFFVPGLPRPAGSKRAFIVRAAGAPDRVAVADTSGTEGKAWRAVVQLAAREAQVAAGDAAPLTGPLSLHVTFLLPRPRSHYGKRGLRLTAPAWPTVRPDCTKLLRAVEDACTAVLWRDDAAVVEQVVTKRYADGAETPGASVEVGVLG